MSRHRLMKTAIAVLTLGLAPAATAATLYAADNLTDGSASGVVILDAALNRTGAFVTTGPVAGIATDGGSVYVSVDTGIAKYDPAGNLEGQYANIGTDQFASLATSGGALYAADNLSDGSLSGVVTLATATLVKQGAFVTTGPIAGLASGGGFLFASLTDGIGKFSLTGSLLGTYQNIGTDSFGALSFAGGTLFAADNLTDGSLSGVVQLDDMLNKTGAFVTDGHVAGIASDGVNVFTSLPTGITDYTTTGGVVASYANIGTDQFGALAFAPDAVPEPATWAMFVAGFGAIGALSRRRVAATA